MRQVLEPIIPGMPRMVGAVHNVRLRDGRERQRSDAAVGGPDRLVFDYCRHLCYSRKSMNRGEAAM